jgi:hypothetical protein
VLGPSQVGARGLKRLFRLRSHYDRQGRYPFAFNFPKAADAVPHHWVIPSKNNRVMPLQNMTDMEVKIE